MDAMRYLACLAGLLLLGAGACAEPTELAIRVLARDAKFIGSSMGGVRIVLRDAQTREVLASGVTQGSTGNTKLIMDADASRREVIVDAGTAAYRVTLALDAPRLIEVEAYGPLGYPRSAQRVTATQWVVPGRHLTGGNGWVLEMPGFVVDVLAPAAHAVLPAGAGIELRAEVVMMCGCPIEPGGLWDADPLVVRASVRRDGRPAGTFDLAFAGETSRFAGTVPATEPGVYEITVFAHDPRNGNTGLDRRTYVVR